MFGRTFRARSPNNVLDEIEWLKNEYGAEGIQFQDDTFSFDKKRAIDICDGMIERKINLMGLRNPSRRYDKGAFG